jgi:hypothetical protein
MSGAPDPIRAGGWPLHGWLAIWRLTARYHRYSVRGLEHLDAGRSCLLVGYHGRPWAMGMCLVTVPIYDRYGYMLHGVYHRAMAEAPVLKTILAGLGGITGDDERLAEVIARGEHIGVTPGGAAEGLRTSRHRHQVDWGQRTGYLRFAIKHRLPLIPVGGWGEDNTYLSIVNGDRLGRAVHMPFGMPLWTGIGPLGFWPISPPFPVRIRQTIGAPILDTADGGLNPKDSDALLALHDRVTARVQDLINQSRHD